MTSPVRPAEGLLEQIAEHALDDDYYVVRAGEPYGERPRSTVLVGVVAAVLAAMLTIAALQTQSDRASNDLERRTLAADVEDRRQVLAARQSAADALRDQVAALQGAPQTDTDTLDVVSGAAPATGEALVVRLASSPDGGESGRLSARDLLTLVNGLWYAGAEAVAVDGQRLTSTSSIGSLDGAVTVNFRRVDPPLRVVAIGDGPAMLSRLEGTETGQYLALRTRAAGLEVAMTPSDEESVPAAPVQRTTPLQARAVQDGRSLEPAEGEVGR